VKDPHPSQYFISKTIASCGMTVVFQMQDKDEIRFFLIRPFIYLMHDNNGRTVTHAAV
jgi:hypothetical protein